MDEENKLKLEELKIVFDQKKFFVSRYLQAAAFYFAISGLALNMLINITDKLLTLLITSFCLILNLLVLKMAGKFRDVVYHYLNREKILCEDLSYAEPAELIWGYTIGSVLIVVIMISFLVVGLIKYFH